MNLKMNINTLWLKEGDDQLEIDDPAYVIAVGSSV